jgi:Family of unknown function (DUF5941)/CDP-alcohol phosphatidyltransferase
MPVGTALTRLTDGLPQTAAPEPGQTPAPSGRDGRDDPATAVTTAVLFATARAGDAPAATLPWGERTIVARLIDQLAGLGIPSIVVITRPAWENALRRSLDGREQVELTVSTGAAEDLRAIARLARNRSGGILLAAADVVTHTQALAGLLGDARLPTGALCASRPLGHELAFRTRAIRGRVLSASSAYHDVRDPTMPFLDVLKVAALNRTALAGAADRLAGLVEPPLAPAFEEELRRKAQAWRLEPGPSETELESWLATAPEDVVSLALVGLVRSGVHVGVGDLRDFFWSRPLSPVAAESSAREITGFDEDRALLDSAVKANDGFFTTFFVSPYSKYVARWAARRGWTPNLVSTVSLVIGLIAAAAFATGERAGLVAGAILLQLSFTTDCVDGQLARYTRTFSRLGAWLDSIFDRTKEYAVFGGLAIGAAQTGDPVWVLAGAALALQTVRHEIDFTNLVGEQRALAAAAQPPLEQASDGRAGTAAESGPAVPAHQDDLGGRIVGGLAAWGALNRWPAVEWLKKIVAFPIGERFAAISITAAVADARTTFVVLLAWGGLATVYKMAGRVLRSLVPPATRDSAAADADALELYRDDGPLARALGSALGGSIGLPAIALVIGGALPLLALIAFDGSGASDSAAGLAVAWLALAGGVSSGSPNDGPLGWATIPVLRLGEYAGILWLAALAGGAGPAAAFALLAALAFRHYDLMYRLRYQGTPTPRRVGDLAGGWEGRLLAGWALLAADALPAGFFALAATLGGVFAGESIASWTRTRNAQAVLPYIDDEAEEQ